MTRVQARSTASDSFGFRPRFDECQIRTRCRIEANHFVIGIVPVPYLYGLADRFITAHSRHYTKATRDIDRAIFFFRQPETT